MALHAMQAKQAPAAEGDFRIPAKAKSIIYLHMAGSPPHLDLFDYKPELVALLSRYYRSQGQDEEADRLRVLAKRSRVSPSGGGGFRVTISGGATFARPSDTAVEVVERADALLYESKRVGRDRITHDIGDGNATHRQTVLRSGARRHLDCVQSDSEIPQAPDSEEAPPSSTHAV